MKSGPILLAVFILVGLIFAVETCVDCADFVNAPNGRLLVILDSDNTAINIFAFYENNSGSPSRVPINNAILIIELTNSSDMDPEIYKVYTDDEGQATFDFTNWAQACVDMKVLYCPFCADESANCGFAECLSFSGLHSEAGYYYNTLPGEEILNASSIPAPAGSVPPAVLNDGKFLPDVTVSNYCAPPSNYVATPAMCLPLIIIFALLGGALYLSGQNPFGVFNLGSPRMGKHIRYQAKGRGFSLNLMSLVQAGMSIAGTVNQVKKAKAEAAKAVKDGKKGATELTTAQAYRQVGNTTAKNSVFLVSGIGRTKQGLKSNREAKAAAAAKGGTKSGQQLRAGATPKEGSRGSVEVGAGGQIRSGMSDNRNTGAGLMQKWGGGESGFKAFGLNLAAGLTTIGLGLVMNIPILQLASSITTACGGQFDPIVSLERAGVKGVADAQANVKSQTDANGNLKVETPDGKPLAIEKFEPSVVEVPKLDETGKPVIGEDGKPEMVPVAGPTTTVTFVAPAKEEKPPEVPVAADGTKAAEPAKVAEPAVTTGQPAAGTTTGEAPKAGEQKTETPVPPAQAKVDVTMDNKTGQVTSMGYETKDGSKVIAEPATDGSTKLSVTPPADPKAPAGTPPPEPQKYMVAADGTVTGADGKPVDAKQAETIRAMAAPATNGENVSGLKLGDTPTMPQDSTSKVPILSGLGNLISEGSITSKPDTFLAICQESAIQYQEASEHLTAALITKGAELHEKFGENVINTPEGKELLKAATTVEATRAIEVALGKPVGKPEEAAATTLKLGETLDNQATFGTQHGNLFRADFGARAAEGFLDTFDPIQDKTEEKALRVTGTVIDDLVRTTSLPNLERMRTHELEAAVIDHLMKTPDPDYGGKPPTEKEARAFLDRADISLSHAVNTINSAAKDLRAGMVDHMGVDAARQMENIPPRQFAQLCESATLVYRAQESPTQATELVLRSGQADISKLPDGVRAQVAEYAAVKVALNTNEGVGHGGYSPDTHVGAMIHFNNTDRMASERAQEASIHAVEIAVHQDLWSQAKSLDDEHRKLLPKGFEPMMEAHAAAFDKIAQANLTQIRYHDAGLLDPVGSQSSEGTLIDMQRHEQETQQRVREGLGHTEREQFLSGISYDTGPIIVGKQKTFEDTDYVKTATTLAEQSEKYRLAGDDTSAEMYRESLFSLTRAREAEQQRDIAERSGDTKSERKFERARDQHFDQVEKRLAPPDQVELWTSLDVKLASYSRAKGEAELELANARERAEKMVDAVHGAVSRQIMDHDGADKPFH
ncbi:MAG: hypothetical protein ABID61_02915 [Candidatus Micrarchaeota archaeon]